MNYEKRISEIGIDLPELQKPVAKYLPSVRAKNLLFISGQIPIKNGNIEYKGKLGRDVTIEQGGKAAKLCTINALSVMKYELGDLDKIERIIKITGYVNSTDDFFDQPKVVNYASELMIEIFGERGKHSRAAVGVNALPLNCAVEIEFIVQIKE